MILKELVYRTYATIYRTQLIFLIILMYGCHILQLAHCEKSRRNWSSDVWQHVRNMLCANICTLHNNKLWQHTFEHFEGVFMIPVLWWRQSSGNNCVVAKTVDCWPLLVRKTKELEVQPTTGWSNCYVSSNLCFYINITDKFGVSKNTTGLELDNNRSRQRTRRMKTFVGVNKKRKRKFSWHGQRISIR